MLLLLVKMLFALEEILELFTAIEFEFVLIAELFVLTAAVKLFRLFSIPIVSASRSSRFEVFSLIAAKLFAIFIAFVLMLVSLSVIEFELLEIALVLLLMFVVFIAILFVLFKIKLVSESRLVSNLEISESKVLKLLFSPLIPS